MGFLLTIIPFTVLLHSTLFTSMSSQPHVLVEYCFVKEGSWRVKPVACHCKIEAFLNSRLIKFQLQVVRKQNFDRIEFNGLTGFCRWLISQNSILSTSWKAVPPGIAEESVGVRLLEWAGTRKWCCANLIGHHQITFQYFHYGVKAERASSSGWLR